ncbi:MAG: lamin tail domain-containing protein [Chloroflexota bacterium]
MFRFITLFILITAPFWQATPLPNLRLTEVFYDTPGDDAQEEWVELVSWETAVYDLSDIKLGDEEKAGGSEGMYRFPVGATIDPGQVIVVAQTAVGYATLYGVLPDYEFVDSHPDVPNMRRFPIWASGDLALGNGGDDVLLLDPRNQIIDALSYGDSTAVLAPAISSVLTGQSIERIPASCDSNTAADWQPQNRPTPGQITLEGDCPEIATAADLETLPPIGTIQSRRDASPLLNQTVTFRGIVTGLHADRNASGITYYTLFVQDLPGTEDGDPATSDGIAVFMGRRRPTVQLGDQVRVSGQITEFFGLTEVDDNNIEVRVEASGLPLPDPLPLPLAGDLEPLEGMRVMVAETAVVVNPTYRSCGFAVRTTPGRPLRQQASDVVGGIVPVLHHSESDGCGDFPDLKTGDQVSGLVGPLTYNFDEFKIVLQQPDALTIAAAPLPPVPTPPAVGEQQFSLASFNVENLFDTVDDTGDDAEPKPTTAQLAAKEGKIAQTIALVLGCPTLLGVQEVENGALLEQIAARLEPDCGFRYTITHRESADGRGIDVALLSDPRRVMVVSAELRQGCTRIATGIVDGSIVCGAGEQPLFSRPPLEVVVEINGRFYTLLINHFKSKRGGEAETAPRRLAQAQHVNGLVNEQLSADPEARIIVLGDLNDYEGSPSTLAMQEPNGRLANALALIPDAQRYSFIFGGVSQLIDAILLSSTLAEELVTATILHVNADFPDSWSADPDLLFRSADHDPPLVVLALPVEEAILPTPTVVVAVETAVSPAPVVESGGGSWGWVVGLVVVGMVGGGTAVYWWTKRPTP